MSIGTGLVVLVGWSVDLETLKRAAPGRTEIDVDTALALIAAGGALICLRRGAAPSAQRVGRLLGVVIAVLGCAVLFEYQVPELGFDQLLPAGSGGADPGMPSVLAAAAFTVFGLATATVDARGWRGRLSAPLALLFAIAWLLGATGYLFGADHLRPEEGRTGIAPATLFALAFVATGLLCLRPDRGPLAIMRGADAGARMARLLVPAAILGPLALGALRFVGEESGAFGERVDATASTLVAVVGLLAVVLPTAWYLRRTGDATRRLAAIADASSDAIVGVDTALRVTSWNPGARALFGYPASTALGKRVEDLIPPSRAEELSSVSARLAAGEDIRGWQTEGLAADGSVFPMELSASVLRDEDGRVSGGAAIVRDLRERREAELRFQALLEAAPDAFVIAGADGRIVFANEQVERFFGYRRCEVVGEPVELLVPSSFRDQHVALMRKYLEMPRRLNVGDRHQLKGRRRDGSEFPVEISLSPLETEEGPMIFAAVRDVTERRETEEALASSEERFRSTFMDSGVGMALVSVKEGGLGPAFEFNQAFTEILGYSAADLIETPATELVDPADLSEALEDLGDLIEGRVHTAQREVRLLAASGAVVWASVTGSIVHEADGSPSYLVVQVQDVSDRKAFELQLQYLADHDGLTGFFNRRRFEEELERELRSSAQTGNPGTVAVLDLDHFKFVNDTLGHATGDRLIASLANLIRDRLRAIDVLGRLGGDEFALILPGLGLDQARDLCEEVLVAVRNDRGAAELAATARVTASVGMTSYRGFEDAGEVLAEADIAMYDAKEAGRDRASVFDPASSRHEHLGHSLGWIERVEQALVEDRFVLHAQPILPVKADSMRRFELLLRMVGEDGELVLPGEFLQMAERSDLAQRIDRWVVARAVEMLAAEERRGQDVCFAVNLSANSIGEEETGEEIARTISAGGVDPRRLVFEVTETAAIVNLGRAQAFARKMHQLGCGFALDDFGAGFASFFYLKHLSFDLLKIDGEFIRALPSNRTDQLVVRSLIQIARGLGKRTIAEFVGSEQTLALLREYGVDFVQGYHLGKPGPLEDFLPAGSSTLAG